MPHRARDRAHAPDPRTPRFLGAPILGDVKYGNRRMNDRCGFKTQALCAASVTFRDIPAENTLSYLAGRTIALEEPEIIKIFAAL